jgi:muramoyltetrapeptide carboxypeptidase
MQYGTKMKIFPSKLRHGDEVRIVAPSLSLATISQGSIDLATQKLESLGLKVTFGKHVYEKDLFESSSIQSRVDDLHEAFRDQNVKLILAARGGSNANQLLKYLDYDLIKHNPKILCGYSDINALQNAIFHKTGLVTYSGPEFGAFAMQQGFEYTVDYFKKILFEDGPIEVTPSTAWSDDAWQQNQDHRTFHTNKGYWIIHQGKAKGTIVGGNLSTFQLLQGTSYMPSLQNTILFVEADSVVQEKLCVVEFDRAFQSLIYQPHFDKVKAIVFGRFETKFGMDLEKLKMIIATRPELNSLPIIANVDFGHTKPLITFPMGGTCEINMSFTEQEIKLIEQ